MLKPKSPQNSFFGSYLYDKIIPSDHLLRKINQVVDFSFIHDLVKDKYTPDFGRPAEDPEFMLRLCLLQYIYNDSDRAVVANAQVNLAYKYFLGLAVDEEVPDYTTISLFRAGRLGEEKFRGIFENIVKQCIEKGLVTGRHQIVDSTHIVADIAINSLAGIITMCRQNVLRDIDKQNHKIATKLGIKETQFTKQDKYTRMEEGLEKEIEEATTLLDDITGELKEGNLKPSPELVKDLELLQKAAIIDRDDDSKDRLISPIDPDARMGRKASKRWAGYKGHVVIEEDSEIITAVETTPANRNDGNQLKPLLDQQQEAYSLKPNEISADKAYDSGANFELLDSKGITGNISLTKKTNNRGKELFTVEDFSYDAENDTLTCPSGCMAPYHHRAVFQRGKQKKHGSIFQFKPEQCSTCHLKHKCNNGHRGRAVYTSFYEPLYQHMKQRMESKAGKEAYRNRYRIEHKVADLARYCGMRHCRYRGLGKAKVHTLLSAIVSNVKRMARLLWNISTPPLERRTVVC